MIKINYIARTWTLLLVMKLIQSLADRITFVPFFESESLLFCQNAIKKKFPVHHKINRTRSKKKTEREFVWKSTYATFNWNWSFFYSASLFAVWCRLIGGNRLQFNIQARYFIAWFCTQSNRNTNSDRFDRFDCIALHNNKFYGIFSMIKFTHNHFEIYTSCFFFIFYLLVNFLKLLIFKKSNRQESRS